MSILASVHHLTHYLYDRPVTLGPQIIRLRPAPHSRTRVVSHSLKVTPANHFVNYQQDPYGNWLARYVRNAPSGKFCREHSPPAVRLRTRRICDS